MPVLPGIAVPAGGGALGEEPEAVVTPPLPIAPDAIKAPLAGAPPSGVGSSANDTRFVSVDSIANTPTRELSRWLAAPKGTPLNPPVVPGAFTAAPKAPEVTCMRLLPGVDLIRMLFGPGGVRHRATSLM